MWLKAVVLLCLLISPFGWAEGLPERIVLATHDQSWYPIEYPNDEGQYIGPWMQRLDRLFRQELSVELEVTRQPWRRAQQDVRAGRADIMITLPTEERLSYTELVDGPFYAMTFQLLVPRDHAHWDRLQGIESLEDLQRLDLNLVSTFSNGWFEQNVAKRGIRADYVKTDRQQIQFLLSGRADGLIDFPVTMTPLLEEMGAMDRLTFLPAVLDTTEFRIMVSHQSPWMAHQQALEAALQRVSERGF